MCFQEKQFKLFQVLGLESKEQNIIRKMRLKKSKGEKKICESLLREGLGDGEDLKVNLG